MYQRVTLLLAGQRDLMWSPAGGASSCITHAVVGINGAHFLSLEAPEIFFSRAGTFSLRTMTIAELRSGRRFWTFAHLTDGHKSR